VNDGHAVAGNINRPVGIASTTGNAGRTAGASVPHPVMHNHAFGDPCGGGHVHGRERNPGLAGDRQAVIVISPVPAQLD